MVDTHWLNDSADRLSSEDTSLPDVLAEVAQLNSQLEAEGLRADAFEKLKEWIGKLLAKLDELLTPMGNASFTITVGQTISVAVTITASRRRDKA
jgi:hypothetical protein